MTSLIIYSRPGCHLCHEMKILVERVVRDAQVAARIEEVNVADDAGLETRYGLELPVLLVNGRKVAKYRVTEEALTRILETPASGGG